MLYLMLIIHLVGLLAGMYCIFIILNRTDTEYKTSLVLATMTCLIGVASYCFELQVTTVSEMIMVIKMGYIGKCYTMSFALIFISQYYKVGDTTKMYRYLFILDTLVLAFILTLDYHWMYYSKLSLEFKDGFYTCVLETTPFYYLVMLTGELKLLGYLIVCFLHKVQKKTLESTVRLLLIIAGVVPFVFQVSYLMGLSGRYDICPIASIITYCVITLAVTKFGLFDTVSSAREIIVESSLEAIFVVNAEYRLLYANPAAKKIYPELKKKKLLHWFEPAKKLVEERPRYFDHANRFYEIHCSELRNNNVLHGYILWMIDITELRQYNLEILDLKDKAEMAAKAKTDFLANMSHEIRTPMNAIIGMSEMALLGRNLPHKEREYIQQIKMAGRSLLSIINDILDFSKIESGKMEISEAEYGIIGLTSQLSSMVQTRIGEKDIKFMIDIVPNFPIRLYGDDIRIQQIILNLLTNAVKFTTKGAIVLKLDYKNDRLYVEVSDTGIGIRKKDQKKLFETFQQVDTKRNRSIEGSGLGLSISKQLVSLMGGELRLDSIYEVGSSFYFDIPQRVVDPTPCARITNSEPEEVGISVANEYIRFSMVKYIADLGKKPVVLAGREQVAEYLKSPEHFVLIGSYEEYKNQMMAAQATKKGIAIVLVGTYETEDDLVDQRDVVLSGTISSIAIADVLNGDHRMDEAFDEYRPEDEAPLTGKILLVDDNLVNLKVAEGLLSPFDLEVHTASSAAMAYEKLLSQDFDIIFMDHMMPDIDGVEAAHHIRQMEGEYYQKVPIIAFTANAVGGIKEMFIKEGMNDFIAKPLDYKEFVQKIRHWLPE